MSVESLYNARVLSISYGPLTVGIGHIGWTPVGITVSGSWGPSIPASASDVSTTTAIGQAL
jgi:hypothetical protein